MEEEEGEEEEGPSPRNKAKAASLFFLDSFFLWIFSLLTSSIPLQIGPGVQEARAQNGPWEEGTSCRGCIFGKTALFFDVKPHELRLNSARVPSTSDLGSRT